MFRSTTIIRELELHLAKVIFMFKHSVKLRRYILCGDVAACHRAAHNTHTALLHCTQHTHRSMTCCHITTQYITT